MAGTYNPNNADYWKALIRTQLQAKIGSKTQLPMFLGAVRVDVIFFFPRPKDHFKGKSTTELKPTAPVFHAIKPDRDNLDKAVLDALTTTQIFRDDCQVADGFVRKLYANPGQVTGARIIITHLVNTIVIP